MTKPTTLIKIGVENRDRLKTYAFQHNTTMKAIIGELIENHLNGLNITLEQAHADKLEREHKRTGVTKAFMVGKLIDKM